MKHMPFFRSRLAPLALAVLGLAMLTSQASALTLTIFTDPHPVMSGGTIGFAYAGNKFVGSVQRDGLNVLYSTDLTGGNVQVFAPSVFIPGNPSSEHFVASSLGLGGFPSRDVYVAAANGIIHIDNAGTAGNTFVAGLANPVRGILFDAIGTFGGDMLVTTTGGQIYRINSAGTAALLASVGEDTEGLDIAPLGAGFGGHDGELIVASEGSGLLRAITTAGVVTALNPSNRIASAEELTFVPLNLGASGDPVEGFYGSNYTPNVVKGDVSQFTGFLGDAIVTGETTHIVHRVHWNGSSFEITSIGSFPDQPEDGIFVTAAIINPGSTLTDLSPAHLWSGLRNSDDQGTQFDLMVEVLKNDTPVASGLKRCITSLTRNPGFAKEVIVPFDPFDPVSLGSGDVLSLRVSTRIGTNPNGTKCPGPGGSHNNAVGLRLYYDSANRASLFDATITPNASENLYLHSDRSPCHDNDGESTGVQPLTLDGTAPTAADAQKKCKDSGHINFNGGNPFSLVGTWSLAPLP